MLNPVSDAFVQALQKKLPSAVFGADPTGYRQDPRKIIEGRAQVVLRPGSTDEVATIVRAANAARVGVIPYGGGTGLVGGQQSPDVPEPLVLALDRMNRIRAVHRRENVLVAEAGAPLRTVQTAAEAADRLYPLSLASEGSARIGGTLSTNAGGVQVLRYGSARDLCLGLEAVLPDGSVHHGLKRLRKDNTGYDLRNLLIGAEGTLGVITAAALRLFPRPGDIATAYLAVTDPAAALGLLALAGARLGAGLTAFELIHRQGLDFMDETGIAFRDPLTDRPDWAVLVEVALPQGRAAEDALTGLYSAGHATGLVTDGIIASSHAQRDALWQLRENIPEANRRIGAVASHDIALPLSVIPNFIARAQAVAAKFGAFRVNCFGHLGDGNLHYNIFPPPGILRDPLRDTGKRFTRALHDLVDAMGGSFSAEHGVGRVKVDDLARYGDPAKLAAMRAIKSALDPHGIMNPGAIFG